MLCLTAREEMVLANTGTVVGAKTNGKSEDIESNGIPMPNPSSHSSLPQTND